LYGVTVLFRWNKNINFFFFRKKIDLAVNSLEKYVNNTLQILKD